MACLQLAPAGVKEGRATGSARCQCSISGGGGKVSRGRTSEAGTAAWRSHGGTVFEMPIDTVHCLGTYRPFDRTCAAEMGALALQGGVFLVRGSRQLCRWPRCVGGSEDGRCC
ncbi:hypothetical protein PVAP13_8NG295636 [Panicum virgatum]|uniref:Uncharacterized protein n=1 Tax=Panicum virgatum TaxID=38727 RepID=A0A8T0PAL6_PANVG|nr:hypothetical protein PVAP13_8NG295636 [Panicum virgatum]